jgi:cytochrome c-type biogenesis protein CcmE
VVGILAGVSIAGALALSAFQKNVMFFFDPTQVAAGEVKMGQRFRLGGMVSQGTFRRTPGSLEVHFVVTDLRHELPVKYSGVLPDLFREGQGVVAHGKLGDDGVFVADEVLAKHDENYMPPEVAKSLKKPAAAGSPEGAAADSARQDGMPHDGAPHDNAAAPELSQASAKNPEGI